MEIIKKRVHADRALFLQGLRIPACPAVSTAQSYFLKHCDGFFCLEIGQGFLTVSPAHREHIPIKENFPVWVSKKVRDNGFYVSTNLAFAHVLEKCARIRTNRSPGEKPQTEEDRWIRENTVGILKELRQDRQAHSIDIWKEDELVGGAIGIQTGGVFISLSVFSEASSAGYTAFIALQLALQHADFDLHDAIMPSTISRIFGGGLVTATDDFSVREKAVRKTCLWPDLVKKHVSDHFPDCRSVALAEAAASPAPSLLADPFKPRRPAYAGARCL